MSQKETADRFIQALGELEKAGSLQPICELFSEECDLKNINLPQVLHGKEAAKHFWRDYCHSFQEIETQFTHRSDAGDTVTLEWISRGKLKTGEPFQYSGVTILECQDDGIRSFRAYYDSAALHKGPAKRAA